MALYNEQGDLVGYRWAVPEPPKPHRLYEVGTHVILKLKDLSQVSTIAVSVA
jgi:hypothetical protein